MAHLENIFWNWLRPKFVPLLKTKNLQINRVENMAGSGMPDVEGCYFGTELQIELKASEIRKRPTSQLKYDVKKSQIFWHENRYKAGGLSYVLIRVGSSHQAIMYLVRGRFIRSLHKISQPALEKIAALKTDDPIVVLDFIRHDDPTSLFR